MTKLIHSLPAKIVAIFLLIISVLGIIGSAVGIHFMVEDDFYTAPIEETKKGIYSNITRRYANRVFFEYLPDYEANAYNLSVHKETFSDKKTNFLFILKDPKGEIVLTNYSNEKYLFSTSYHYRNGQYVYNKNYDPNSPEEDDTYTIYCFVKETLTANDEFSRAEYWIDFGYSIRYLIIAIALFLVVASVTLFVFLMCSAGRRKGEDKIILNGIDKIPFDILLIVVILIAAFSFELLFEVNSSSNTIGIIIVLAILIILNTLLFLLLFMSFAARYKKGSWWKNTIIYIIFKFCFGLIGKIYKLIGGFIRNFSLLWKVILGLFLVSLGEFVAMVIAYNRGGLILILWILEKFILIPAILLLVMNLRKLQIGGQKIAEGDLNYTIDTDRMFWDFKRHGENLNSISDGMSRAVNERLKSEKFKTELITNVSHDIKTPLTSIINYVDLVKKEVTEDGTLKGYVDVLERQSARLKKLTEDLVEASKASTGNMTINMEPTEVGLLLTQAVGEYEEKIKNCGLELVLTKPEEEIFILADGRLLWRVFDNLLSNICKYSQPGTRAYLNLEIENNEAVTIFRNVSKYPLNITSDELFERFIRGDSSRNTEGSGLGLSIARSLIELQKGVMELYIDGDLFKVIIKYDIYANNTASPKSP